LVTSSFFSKILKKSITEEFSENELYKFSSDLVITNATIKHVGGVLNQKKMIENIIKLTKKILNIKKLINLVVTILIALLKQLLKLLLSVTLNHILIKII